MQFGICTSPASAAPFAQAGFDFLELNVQQLLQGEAEESAFLAGWEKARSSPLPCLAANSFIPGHIKVTGPEADTARLEAYVATICRRAEIAGIQTIVFGSGGARNIPGDFSRVQAWKQLVSFGRMAAETASRHGVTIVAEPLNKKECNILNCVEESAEYVREVGHPRLRLLVDSYHWWLDDNDEKALGLAGELLHHVHVATLTNRLAPGEEPADFSLFFMLLRGAGYRGPISIEAGWKDPAVCAPRALQILSRNKAVETTEEPG